MQDQDVILDKLMTDIKNLITENPMIKKYTVPTIVAISVLCMVSVPLFNTALILYIVIQN